MTKPDLTAEVKGLARDNRMDLVGIADPARYHAAPARLRPDAHIADARAVVAFAIRYPFALFERAGKEPACSMMSLEAYQNKTIGRLLTRAAMRIARFLEDHGFEAKPMTVSGKWRIHPYKDIPTEWCADFSNRHAAVAAGLGEFGLHGLAITPQFGMKQRFCSVITNAPLTPDPMYAGPPLCDRCMACVKVCPVKAINPGKLETVTIGDRTWQYATIDHWRCAWSEQTNMVAEEGPQYFGQAGSFPPPAEGPVDDDLLLQTFYRKNREVGLQASMTHAMGACMRVCTPPHLRGRDRFDPAHLSAAPYPDGADRTPGPLLRAGRALALVALSALGPLVSPAAETAPAVRPLGVITRFDAAPVGPLPPYLNWRWNDELKRAAGTFTRREIMPHPDGTGRVLRLEVDAGFPWQSTGERLLELTRAFFPPESDAVMLRVKVISGTFTLAIGGPTAYFGDSDVLTAPQRLDTGAWQDLPCDLNTGLCRNFRRAGFGRTARAITYNRWAQEPPALYILPGSAGVLLLESATLVATGRGRPFAALATADLTPLHRAPTAPANAFTLLMADSQQGEFALSWSDPSRCRYPPPRLAAVAGPNAAAGAALAATAAWAEEIRWAGVKVDPAATAQAIALTVRASPAGLTTQVASLAGQPLDIALLCSGRGAVFPWARLGPPQANVSAAATTPGYTVDFSHRAVLAAQGLNVAAYTARRFVRAETWETLVVPLEDFACIAAAGDLLPQLANRASPAGTDVAGVAWLLPWPRDGGPAERTIEVADVQLVAVTNAALLHRSYPAPQAAALQPLTGLSGYGGWVQAARAP